jgi:hypothetical protein
MDPDSDPDADPDPVIFIIALQDANKKQINSFSAYYLLMVHLHNFSTKKSQRGHKPMVSYYFCS